MLYVVASAVGAWLLAEVPADVLERQDTSVSLSLAFMPVVLVFAVIGAVVASRLPRNPIGWLFLALAQLQAVYGLAFGYAQYATNVDPSLPAIEWAAWVATWTTPLTPIVVALALLLFPDGRHVSRRWRFVVWACVPIAAVVLADYTLGPGRSRSCRRSTTRSAGLNGSRTSRATP